MGLLRPSKPNTVQQGQNMGNLYAGHIFILSPGVAVFVCVISLFEVRNGVAT